LNLLFFIRYPARSLSFAKTQKFRRRVPFVPFFSFEPLQPSRPRPSERAPNDSGEKLAVVIIFTFLVVIVKGGFAVFKRSRKIFAQKPPNVAPTTRGYRFCRPPPPQKLTFAAPKFQNALFFRSNVLILTKITGFSGVAAPDVAFPLIY